MKQQRKICLTVSIILLLLSKTIHSQQLEWAVNLESTSHAIGYDIKADKCGNIYVAGSFHGIVDFDPSASVADTLAAQYTSAGELYVMKMNSNGKLLWVKGWQEYDVSDNPTIQIAVDNQNNVYAAGQTRKYITPQQGVEAFIVKFDSLGNKVWRKTVSDTADFSYTSVLAKAIDVDGNCNVYLVGQYDGTVDFDPSPASMYLKTTYNGYPIAYVLKLDSAGNFIWQKQIESSQGVSMINSIKINKNNLWVAGTYNGNPDFDLSPTGTYTIGSTQLPGPMNCFLAKYDINGNFSWVNGTENTGVTTWAATMSSIDVNENDGSIYLSGSFQDSMKWHSAANIGNMVFSKNYLGDMFFMKLDSMGNFKWINSIGSRLIDQGLGVQVDNENNIIFSGLFAKGSVFYNYGTDSIDASTITDVSMLVFKTDSLGHIILIKPISNASSAGGGLAFDKKNNSLYVTGGFEGTTDFNPASTNSYYMTSINYPQGVDIFIAKYDTLGFTVNVENTGNKEDDIITLFPNPVNNELYFRTPSNLSGSILITDLIGNYQLQTKVNTLRNNTLDVSGLQSGIYILTITDTERGRMSFKIIKE
ncbi:MAG: T9SS type A sorting domain-containing protein [Bacteroidetes bacterium]|nr:T9SS type A sorting domain-containing protein [Bacteroidota bacterium]